MNSIETLSGRQSEIMECRSIILKKREGNASWRFGLPELIKSTYRPDKIF